MTQCEFSKPKCLILPVFYQTILLCCTVDATENTVKVETKNALQSWAGTDALSRSVFVERQERLQFNCDNLPEKSDLEVKDNEIFRNFLVDEEHELLYCYVPKVACTNWKRIMMVVMKKWQGSNPLMIPADQVHAAGTFKRLSNYTLPEIKKKLKTYERFLIVRHPLERLLSAYRNKFEMKNKYFRTRFGKRIIKMYRSNATQESLNTGDDVTFPEFVDFVTDSKNNESLNEHWRPISDLCHPCLVNFNIISKYETLSEDAAGILEQMGSSYIVFPTRSPFVEPTANKLDKYYSSLSYTQLQRLLDIYKLDLTLFDYSLEDILGFSLA